MPRFVYSVYDVKGECFSDPMTVPHVGVALRSFTDEVNNPQSQLHRHPEDFRLFELGTFEEREASFFLHKQPKLIADASSLLKSPPTAGDVARLVASNG